MLTEREIGIILAAQLMSAVRDSDQSYVSSVGAKYSHLHDPGRKIMAELVELMFVKAVECHQHRKQADAEQLIMDNLKK